MKIRTTCLVAVAGVLVAAVAAVRVNPQAAFSATPFATRASSQRFQAPQAPSSAASTTAPAGNVERGKALYLSIGCYQCHGQEGQGGMAGPRIGPNPIPFRRFVQYSQSPRGEMPPYSPKVVSDQQWADIYAYLEARPRPPAVNSVQLLAR